MTSSSDPELGEGEGGGTKEMGGWRVKCRDGGEKRVWRWRSN